MLAPLTIDGSAVRVSPEAALDSNHIDSVSRVRMVRIDTNWFYQVQRWGDDVPVYLSARNGHKLYQGDWLYAQWLARQFLEGPDRASAGSAGSASSAASAGSIAVATSAGSAGSASSASSADSIAVATSAASDVSPGSDAGMDCCGAAASSVLIARGARIVGAMRLTDFDEEYNAVNRLMPVYRVAFDRPDGIRIYVETVQDRYAMAVDNRRAAFNRIFEYIHTYQWLDFLGKGKQVVIAVLIGLAFITTLLGIYIFFSTGSRRVAGNGYVRARRNHRYTAIVISLFTLAFSFSGAYHALALLKTVPRQQYVARVAARGLRMDLSALKVVCGGPIGGIGLVDMGGTRYWRVRSPGGRGSSDLMRDMKVKAPKVVYADVDNGAVLPDGEQRYARWLAAQFSGRPDSEVVAATLITKFDRDYNFTDKRLPVWRVAYPVNHHERYYVETSSGCLAVRVDDIDLIESYSFALLHKHEFLEGLGKSVKDFSTMFWAAAQVLLVALGLVLYVRSRRRVKPS